MRNFKKTRVVIALLVFLTITLSFLDFKEYMPDSISGISQGLQFLPSIIHMLENPTLLAAGFVVTLVLTLLFGRIYCSTLCPLGTLMDGISRLNNKKSKRRKLRFTPPVKYARMLFLVFTLLPFFFGSLLVINLLDPFSNFGRILSNIFRPLLVGANNGTVFLLEHMDIYSVAPFPLNHISIPLVVWSLVFFAGIFVLAFKKGRLYCNTLCPVGTMLGLVSKLSIYKLEFSEKCTGCGKCERNCKAQCINVKQKDIDFSRCVGCQNCIDVCPEQGLKYRNQLMKKFKPSITPSPARRNMLASMVTLPALALSKKALPAQEQVPRALPVTPPGSISIEHFTDHCTACHACVSACPSQVLQPTITKYGLEGVFMPRMDFGSGYCNYECTKCTDVCPTDAIRPLLPEAKKQVQIGKVVFVRENCVVVKDKKECGACAEHCPTKACTMVMEDGLRVPIVPTEICVGCGACEYACPQKVDLAIYVESNPIHLTAELPSHEELEQPNEEEEFPF